MGRFDGYYKGEKKKLSKKELEKRAKKIQGKNPISFSLPELIRKRV